MSIKQGGNGESNDGNTGRVFQNIKILDEIQYRYINIDII